MSPFQPRGLAAVGTDSVKKRKINLMDFHVEYYRLM
jgi:hypothetical protein